MKTEIQTITPIVPRNVGSPDYLFRTTLLCGENEVALDVEPHELVDYHAFQQAVLARRGVFVNFGMEDAQSPHEIVTRWQSILEAAEWLEDLDIEFGLEEADEMLRKSDEVRFTE